MPLIQYRDINFSPKRQVMLNTAVNIINEYVSDGYILTLRQLYYQFVARDLIPNSEKSYKNLGNLISDGRVAGVIDWDAIEDRGRGINEWLIEEDERGVLDGIEQHFALDYWERQDAYIEVWVEKEALSSVVKRACERWRVPYMACKGYLSVSEAWRAGQRFEAMVDQGRGCHIIHLGDHDPSGIDMSRDNEDRVELFSRQSGVDLHRIALNMDQVEQYHPPPNPAKITDTRATDYIARFGTLSWELDALEPRVLDTLITDTITSHINHDIWRDTAREERAGRSTLAALYDRYTEVKSYLND